MTVLPEWIEQYRESVALAGEDFKMVEALAIALEALNKNGCNCLSSIGKHAVWCNSRIAGDAMRRIEELGK